ncbi:MAG TPA: Lrp/AsnC family transcriptional regulator [Candidatus Acidoferrales bacterium]|nr:Lrp/AsnC family transcriptional regulator [Candidatus Acidoferrales bacterium]
MLKRTKEYQALDFKDRRILQLVQRDGSLAQAEIARRVGLSTAAVNERLRKLRESGVIRRFSALVEPAAVGAGVTAFVDVFMEHPRFESAFLKRVLALDEVLECHHVTGEFSLLLKVRVADMEALQTLLLEKIGALDGVRQTRTALALSTVKEETYVNPLSRGGDA